ncbi:MAG: endonuclease/exonuclease/phosphatase family protein [Gemmatimonadaceae bacterium]|nr:endonuclease/exonuclease/phosphatase family protein [Gemmatimonadaceae bacterium]
MRIVAWNLGHRTKEQAIKKPLLGVLEYLGADVVSFNEYVHGESRESLAVGLGVLGYRHIVVSERSGTQNQVLIASRAPIAEGALRGPALNESSRSNFLHVTCRQLGVEVVGVRAPAYESARDKAAYWAELARLIDSTRSRPMIFIGDLNTDPDGKRASSEVLRELERLGWQIPRPGGEYSWRNTKGTRTRIDHVLLAPSFTFAQATYLTQFGGSEIVGSGRRFVSDHAALVVDVPPPETGPNTPR